MARSISFVAACYLLVYVSHVSVVAGDDISETVYRSETGVVFTSAPATYTTHLVRSTLECAALCAKNRAIGTQNCEAYYVIEDEVTTTHTSGQGGTTNPNGNKAMVCSLIRYRPAYGTISVVTNDGNDSGGSGVYAFTNQPQTLETVNHYALTTTEHGLAAFYRCSDITTGTTNIGILKNVQKYIWPRLSRACSSSLCHQPGLAGTVLQIDYTLTNGDLNVVVYCQAGEERYSNVTCDEFGIWLLKEPLKVACLSKICYRNNAGGRSVYTGTKAVNQNDVTCQRWDLQSPQVHNKVPSLFLEDDYSATQAANYCRDPDFYGQPWCYQISGARWTTCSIPRCGEWPNH